MSLKSRVAAVGAGTFIAFAALAGGTATAAQASTTTSPSSASMVVSTSLLAADDWSVNGYAQCVGLAPAGSAWAVLRQRINPLTYFNYFWCAGPGNLFQNFGGQGSVA